MNNIKLNSKEAISTLVPLYLKKYTMGTVHSIFKNGFNIKFGELLIYITSNKYPLSALGINITEEKLKKILSSIKVSDVVIKKGEKLKIYNIYEIIDVDYKFVERVDLNFPKVKCKITDINKSELYNILTSIDFKEIIGIELDKKTLKYVDLLVKSDKKDLNTNKLIINFLVGRGQGLTPSGDDILIGFTAALMIFGEYKEWITSLKEEVTTEKTTIISFSYLNSLIEGYVSEYFMELIKSLDYNKTILIEEAIEKVKTFGHTSGCDTLFGFILGLKFLINS